MRDNPSPMSSRKPSPLVTRVTLLGALVLMVIGQFVLFPFILSLLVDPFSSSSSSSQRLGEYAAADHQRSVRKRTTRDLYQLPARSADGTFNGVPIYLQESSSWPTSHAHCVGENYQSDSWKQRSCQFTNLCFNITTKEFVLFEAPSEQDFVKKYLEQRPFLYTSDTLLRRSRYAPQSLSLGGLNQKWGSQGIARLEWFPKVVPLSQQKKVSYYTLPDWMVWIPFHSLNGANPGHLVWDDYLPIYTLLDMFHLLPDPSTAPQSATDTISQNFIFPMRYVLTNGDRGLWASCDFRNDKAEACHKMMNKFLKLLVGKDYPYQFTTTQDFVFQPNRPGRSDLICAKTGLAGIASLTDHGVIKMHGWEEEDYLVTHNHGRGGLLYDFRNFMMQNLGFVGEELVLHPPLLQQQQQQRDGKRLRHRIVFSQKSSDIKIRNMDFERSMEVVRRNLPEVQVEGYVFKNHSIHEQIEIVHDASVFVTLCGGGAVTAMFLPPGASVLLYYSEAGGAKNNRMTYKPAFLDWDLFNAMSHLRVHWMPRDTMKTALDEQMLVDLIRHEISLIDARTFTDQYWPV